MEISNLRKVIKGMIPVRLRLILSTRMDRSKNMRFLNKLKSDIIYYYDQQSVITSEEKEIVDYLKINPISIFPYNFQKKYNKEQIVVCLDESNGLRYVVDQNKRLYFKRSFSESYIKSLYHGLLLDQDVDSPHIYLTDEFNLTDNDVIADIGAAEGNFSLRNIEKVKKIYLFECDPEWIEALQATFRPWAEKVVIYNKFVSNNDSETTISIDTFTKTNNDISFLKVDIEGEEGNFLSGAASFLKSKRDLKIAICTYHKEEDQKEFTTLLKNHYFEVNHSSGFIIFYFDKSIKAPFFRRGLLRAQKR